MQMIKTIKFYYFMFFIGLSVENCNRKVITLPKSNEFIDVQKKQVLYSLTKECKFFNFKEHKTNFKTIS